jgi:hypothetical protein
VIAKEKAMRKLEIVLAVLVAASNECAMANAVSLDSIRWVHPTLGEEAYLDARRQCSGEAKGEGHYSSYNYGVTYDACMRAYGFTVTRSEKSVPPALAQRLRGTRPDSTDRMGRREQ